MPVTPRGDASLALLHEVIDVQRPEGLADRPRIGVVHEVVDQRQRPQDARLPARGIAAKNGREVCTSLKSTLAATVSARLPITPTTAAVTAASAPRRARFVRSRSTHGAPRKTQRKHGANVAHTVTTAPIAPANAGASVPGFRYAARKP